MRCARSGVAPFELMYRSVGSAVSGALARDLHCTSSTKASVFSGVLSPSVSERAHARATKKAHTRALPSACTCESVAPVHGTKERIQIIVENGNEQKYVNEIKQDS